MCGQAFNGSSGDIYLPNSSIEIYYGGYGCTWSVEVPVGNVIKAELVAFNLDPFYGWPDVYDPYYGRIWYPGQIYNWADLYVRSE